MTKHVVVFASVLVLGLMVVMQAVEIKTLEAKNRLLIEKTQLYTEHRALILKHAKLQERLQNEYRDALYDLLDRLDLPKKKYAAIRRADYYRGKYGS